MRHENEDNGCCSIEKILMWIFFILLAFAVFILNVWVIFGKRFIQDAFLIKYALTLEISLNIFKIEDMKKWNS